jgi:hypothetical protein
MHRVAHRGRRVGGRAEAGLAGELLQRDLLREVVVDRAGGTPGLAEHLAELAEHLAELVERVGRILLAALLGGVLLATPVGVVRVRRSEAKRKLGHVSTVRGAAVSVTSGDSLAENTSYPHAS